MDDKVYIGHMPELTNDEYHSAPGISKSHLDAIANLSPLHYYADYLDPARVREEKRCFDVGQAVHTALLEPDMLPSRIVFEPKINRRTNAGKAEAAAFELQNAGKLVLSHADHAMVMGIRDAAMRHPVAGGLLLGGRAEQSYFAIDPETEELIKCRVDYIHDDMSMIVDVKSAVDASPTAFGKVAGNYRYDVQAPWYSDVVYLATGRAPENFVWIAFEKFPPYAIGVYYATPEQMSRAREAARRDFHRILHYKRLGQWPDYGEQIQPLTLPSWVKR